jgi:hypothetical protein
MSARGELEREGSELALKLAKAQTETEYERKLGREAKEKAERLEREVARLAEEGRTAATRYQELLNVLNLICSSLTMRRRTWNSNCRPSTRKSFGVTISEPPAYFPVHY